jgi:SAM-dependent methyltransferase
VESHVVRVCGGRVNRSRSCIAHRDPACTVIALDLPEVLPATRVAVEAAGLVDRVQLLAGDMLSVPLETGVDLAVLGNVCHLLAEDANRCLLGRIGAALGPGGRIAIVDVRSLAVYRAWLADAGFTGCTIDDLDEPSGLAVITAVAATSVRHHRRRGLRS